ncbi:TetR/AcrR family transcriptional regulator [Vibrio sp. HN007]|uniref:TetR/AcrR family transcriptional regulator n=1 Tax=Vibrio iocasae TaxID=3098914 RepID=UPI0035D42D10
MKASRKEKIDRIKTALINVGCRKELSEISMYDVAHEAGMSPSTVYHYFSNMNELILDYLVDIFSSFEEIVKTCTDNQPITHWKQINKLIQTSLSDYCDENAIVKNILYTHHQYHDVKSAIVEKDNELGNEIEAIYRRYFVLPQLPTTHNIFVIALEASDSVYFSRNVGLKDKAVNEEAIIVAESYLSHYLPDYLPKVEPKASPAIGW